MKNYNTFKVWTIFIASFTLIGIVLGVAVSLIATATDKSDAKKQMLSVLQYAKQQCIRYEELADEDVSDDLYDVSDKAFTARSAIDYSAPDFYDYIKAVAEANRLNGVLVTDVSDTSADGKIVAFYTDTGDDKGMWVSYLEAFPDISDNLFKSYSERLLIGGYYYDYSIVARGDKNGAVLCYKRRRAEDVDDNRFTLSTLLKGFVFGSEGVMTVTDGYNVIASNRDGKVGELAEESEVIRQMRRQDVFDDLVRVKDGGVYYGVRVKCKNMYIYAYMSEKSVFAKRSMIFPMVMLLYLCAAVAIIAVWQITLNLKRSEQERIDETYRVEKERLAVQAIRANEAKTDFLRRMSHDIRTPINGIRGMIKIGDYYSGDPEKQKECRKKIWDASEYLLGLVNDILYMNKLSTDEPEWKDEKFRLTDVLGEVDAFIGAQAKEAGIKFVADDKDITHDYLYGGKVQLQRVLSNIVSNAVKYNKPNGSVIVQTKETGYNNGFATYEFRCEDTGIGMDEQFMKKMYDPFERENRGEDKPLDGVGLGLSIVKKLVAKGGWNLKVKSKKDVGSVFTVEATFKVIDKWDDLDDLPVSDEAEKLSGYNVLVAEDNDLNYEIVQFMLEVAGAKVTRACNGKQAVEAFKNSKEGSIDVILMDVMMPDTDGLSATKTIRASGRTDSE